MVKVYYVIFRDDKMLGLYTPCKKHIFLDALNLQSFHNRLFILLHEFSHYIFNLCPLPLYNFFSYLIDIDAERNPELDDTPIEVIAII